IEESETAFASLENLCDDDDDNSIEEEDDNDDDEERNENDLRLGNETTEVGNVALRTSLAEPQLSLSRKAASDFGDKIAELEFKLSSLKIWNQNHSSNVDNEKRALAGQMGALCQTIDVALGLRFDMSEVGEAVVRPFVKQSQNYGNGGISDE